MGHVDERVRRGQVLLEGGNRREDRCLDWKAHSLKNYELAEILSYLQANKLVYYRFINAGRRHKTPESGKQQFITHISEYHHFAWLSKPQLAQGMATRTMWPLCMCGLHYRRGTWCLRNANHLEAESKPS